MDTVIANKYDEVLSSLNIEVSKKLEGEYEVDEIISTFGKFFFNKMFLDITAIKDYKDLTNLQKLSMSINMDKVILLLDKDDVISDSPEFLSKLVDMGIYNFTKDENNLMYLYNNPNIYRDVAYLQINKDQEDSDNVQDSSEEKNKQKVIGIKNLTDSAGATTLTYLMKKVLSDYYNVMALEIDSNGLSYFNDKECVTIREGELESYLKTHASVDIFLVDLSKSKNEDLCEDIIYLIEPSTIKINKLTLVDPKIFEKYNDKIIILNKCLLTKDDIADFEVETKLKVFYTLPPLNDKKDVSNELLPFLEKLNLVKAIPKEEEEHQEKKSLFSFFKKK